MQPTIAPLVTADYRACAAAWGHHTIELLDSYASADRIYETAYAAGHCANVLFLELCSGCGEEFEPFTSTALSRFDRDTFCSEDCAANYEPPDGEAWSGGFAENH